MENKKVKIIALEKADVDPEIYPVPQYQTPGAAGADLIAHIPYAIPLNPGDRMAFPTGIKLELPIGIEAQIRPRSGLAFNQGVTVLNSPGTIDSDFRGEVCVILINHGRERALIIPGTRIAQIVFAPVIQAVFVLSNNLTETARGAGGLGSTGS